MTTSPAKKAPVPFKTITGRRFIDLSKPTLALAYDERYFLDPLLKELAPTDSTFNTMYCKSARKVFNLFRQDSMFQKPNLIVSDLRLLHGGSFTDKETGNGFYTGRVLYEYLRRYNKDLAMVIFTTDKPELYRMEEIRDPRLRVISVDVNFYDVVTSAITELSV